MIFGDGAGAVVLRAGLPTEAGALGAFDLGSDGAGGHLISVPGGGSRQPLSGPADPARYFTMAGKEVFKQAILRMAGSCQVVLDRAGWRVEDVDRLVAHQANRRILNQLADQLRLDRTRVVSNIDRVGNTAAASIPLALASGVAEGRIRPGHRVLLTAFGGGLTWGSTVVVWPEVTGCDPPGHPAGSVPNSIHIGQSAEE
jgi:3-oxoacyl-[acyl-carrier-protein] synthase-3